MKLIVGLWNPGKEYAKTRHNVGFMIVDDFVKQEKVGEWKASKVQGCKGELIDTTLSNDSIIGEQRVLFLKPMEYMNRSGGAVGAVARFYKIEAQDILVIHDDIDLPVAKVQLKLWGSSAGHNGLKDIIAVLGTKEFYRLRIGVDRPVNQSDVADYVLTNFTSAEHNLIDDKMNDIYEHIRSFLSQ